MRIGSSVGRTLTMAALAVSVSGCALPPIVTAVSLGADVFSLSETGKSVSDHGISMVMQRDCAMLRVFTGSLCQDYAPDEDTPEGALVALAPLADPHMDSGSAAPMTLPRELAYLDGSLGRAVAAAPAPAHDVAATAFAEQDVPAVLRLNVAAGQTPGVRSKAPSIGGLTYLAAGIEG